MSVNLKKDIKPISYIKTNAAEMLDYVNEERNPIVITQRGEARGIFLDVESYQNMINALAMMKLIQIGEKEIQSGKTRGNKEVFSKLRKRIKENYD